MGTLRILLAMSVVLAHSHGLWSWRMVGGPIAVQLFFIISGFYMTLVLNGKYAPGLGGYAFFLRNRLLRLMPSYLVVVALSLVALSAISLATGQRFGPFALGAETWSQLSIPALAYAGIANLTVFGSDLLLFFGIAPDAHLYATHAVADQKVMAQELLVVPQIWSVGIELAFYLVAPLVVRRSVAVIVAFAAVSVALRVLIYWGIGWNQDPWTYRFFPTEFALFMLGALACKMYRAVTWERVPRRALIASWIGIVGMVVGWQVIKHATFADAHYAFFPLFALALPGMFALTKDWRFDRYLGELSYPIYITHMLVIWIMEAVGLPAQWALLATLPLSVALYEWIDKPVDRFRQVLVARRRAVPTLLSTVS